MTAHTKGIDPACRYRRIPEHLCITNRGEPVPVGGTCFIEARAQVLDQGRVIHDAERGIG